MSEFIGWGLYPIERALNAAFFPGVGTPVRGNGTALLILAPTLALAALAIAGGLSAFAIVRRGFLRIFGRAQ